MNDRWGKWEKRFKYEKLNCPEPDCFPWTWTGSEPINLYSGRTIAVGETVEISGVCNPDFVDSYGDDCAKYAAMGWCVNEDQEYFLKYSDYNTTTECYQTGLNCPDCGCTENSVPALTDFSVERSGRSGLDFKQN